MGFVHEGKRHGIEGGRQPHSLRRGDQLIDAEDHRRIHHGEGLLDGIGILAGAGGHGDGIFSGGNGPEVEGNGGELLSPALLLSKDTAGRIRQLGGKFDICKISHTADFRIQSDVIAHDISAFGGGVQKERQSYHHRVTGSTHHHVHRGHVVDPRRGDSTEAPGGDIVRQAGGDDGAAVFIGTHRFKNGIVRKDGADVHLARSLSTGLAGGDGRGGIRGFGFHHRVVAEGIFEIPESSIEDRIAVVDSVADGAEADQGGKRRGGIQILLPHGKVGLVHHAEEHLCSRHGLAVGIGDTHRHVHTFSGQRLIHGRLYRNGKLIEPRVIVQHFRRQDGQVISSVADHRRHAGVGDHVPRESHGGSVILRYDHRGNAIGRHHDKEGAEIFSQFFSVVVYRKTGALAGNVAASRHRSNGAVLPVGVELVPIAL